MGRIVINFAKDSGEVVETKLKRYGQIGISSEVDPNFRLILQLTDSIHPQTIDCLASKFEVLRGRFEKAYKCPL